MTALETEKRKQTVETQPDSLKCFNESESVSSDLTPEEQLETLRKVDKRQLARIVEYERMGGSIRETGNYMGLAPATVYHVWREPPGQIIPKDSPLPSKLGQAPVVPLDNNGKEKGTSIVVTQEVTEPKQPDGAQSTQTNLSSANNGGVEIRQKNIEQDFPIDTREKITIKIDPDFILDVRGYMQHSGFKGSADDMRKYCA